jgi:hypothetical protein
MPRSGNTTARHYGWDHQKVKDQWRPRVKAGSVECHAHECVMASRLIDPTEPWDLGHTPDRTAWTGPEHQTCNRSEGAIRGHRIRAGETILPYHSRSW